ncbi:MAG: sigma-E processing peptidase SpoIIGA, partial [Lachnospiraceae bacterium]|nr:sigma-E processing peptidase SpoIIGA [Lachnospiraceae bacterium]
MKQIIYVDVYFILNFILHLFLLMTTAFFRQKCQNLKRILLASLFMAGAAVCLPFLCAGRKDLERLLVIPEMLFLLRLGFRFEGIRTFMKDLLVFFILTCFLGGCITAFFQMFQRLFKGNSVFLILGAVFLLFLCIAFLRMELLCLMKRQKDVYSVRLWLRKEVAEGKALSDTGNGLISPYTGEGVTIISKTMAERLPLKKEKMQLIP